jgi:transcriptional regulator with XRE-family HTH domain
MATRTRPNALAVDPASIAERRRAVGLYQYQLARLARISKQYMSRIESGERGLTPDTARRLGLILDAYEGAHIILSARLAGDSAA